MRHTRLALALLLTMALSACGLLGGPETYSMTPEQMRDKLASSELPIDDLVDGSYGMSYRTSKFGDGSVVWTIISERGNSLVVIKVKPYAVADGSRFAIEVVGATVTAERGLAENPSFRSRFTEFAREHCDAVLDGRSFDMMTVNSRTLRPNADENARTERAMNAAGEDYQRREAENMERAYRQEPGGNPWQ